MVETTSLNIYTPVNRIDKTNFSDNTFNIYLLI